MAEHTCVTVCVCVCACVRVNTSQIHTQTKVLHSHLPYSSATPETPGGEMVGEERNGGVGLGDGREGGEGAWGASIREGMAAIGPAKRKKWRRLRHRCAW